MRRTKVRAVCGDTDSTCATSASVWPRETSRSTSCSRADSTRASSAKRNPVAAGPASTCGAAPFWRACSSSLRATSGLIGLPPACRLRTSCTTTSGVASFSR